VAAPVTTLLADGMACRVPVPEAVARINRGAARIVEVSDIEIEAAAKAAAQAANQTTQGVQS